MRKIVLTGGHAATVAIAVAEEIIRRYQDRPCELYWIGAKSAFEGKKVPTLESVHFSKLGIHSYFLFTGRLQRKFGWWTIPSLLKVPFGFFHALFILMKIKPEIIVSFGGFVGLPVVVAGKVLGIPSVLHEQTAAAGLANLWSKPFVTKIALAREESLKYFPTRKSVIIGNPVMTQIKEVFPKDKPSSPPVVYITGGSRGSKVLNEAILPILPLLLKDFYLVHQTGELDYQLFRQEAKKMSSELREKYEVYATIDPMQIDGIYRRADIVVSRAGANTVAEIMLTKRPAILIPIPFSYLDEQTKNALLAKKFGIAEIIKQEELTPSRLMTEIEKLYLNWSSYLEKTRGKFSSDGEAASALVNLMEEIVQ